MHREGDSWCEDVPSSRSRTRDSPVSLEARNSITVGRRVWAEILGVSLDSSARQQNRAVAPPVSVSEMTAPILLDFDDLRRRNAGRDAFRISVGRDEDGHPLAVDLNDVSEGGDGPHGLLVGAIGSGRSDFLPRSSLRSTR